MNASYATNAPQGYMGDWKRGAPLGRPSILPAGNVVATSPKVTLQRVRLDSGGYDSCGAYWGIGQPLYWAATDDSALDITFRADNRAAAKEHVRGIISAARFYR